jgi:hypothetical protein
MINIQTYTNADAQLILNEIKEMLDWYNVIMDGDNVSAIEITSKIKMERVENTAGSLKITDTNINGSDNTVTLVNVSGSLRLIQTDDTVYLFNVNLNTEIFVIGQVTNLEEQSSLGIITFTVSGSSMGIWTDQTTTLQTMSINNVTNVTSSIFTQLLPIVEWRGPCTFNNIYITYLMTNRDYPIGKVTLNGKRYYLGVKFAFEYTP